MIGLKRGTVKLSPYSKEWAILFEKEKSILQNALSWVALDIQHVGSTAIPDMPSKPIIDIAIGIKTIKDLRDWIKPLQKAGYLLRENASNCRVLCFAKGSEDKRTYYLHLVKYHGEIWNNYLAFRDYLMINRESAQQYSPLKEKLAEKYSDNRGKYTTAKADFVRKTIKTARKISLSTS
jgi:GrpB-like predicted nucleotidyltransferase (UPF0157 family)